MSWPAISTNPELQDASFFNAYVAALNERYDRRLTNFQAIPVTVGQPVQSYSLWAGLQGGSTAWTGKFPRNFVPTWNGTAWDPAIPGVVPARYLDEVLAKPFFERRRPREATTFSSPTDTQGNTIATGMIAWILQNDPGSSGACSSTYTATFSDAAVGTTYDVLLTETASGSGVWTGGGYTLEIVGSDWDLREGTGGDVRFTRPAANEPCPPEGASGWSAVGAAATVTLDNLVGDGTGSSGWPARTKDPMPLYTKTASGWNHTPLATADTLSNYSPAPNRVINPVAFLGGQGSLYGTNVYEEQAAAAKAAGDIYNAGHMALGDYFGPWVFEQTKTMLQKLSDQSVAGLTGRSKTLLTKRREESNDTYEDNKSTQIAEAKADTDFEWPTAWVGNVTYLSFYYPNAYSRLYVEAGNYKYPSSNGQFFEVKYACWAKLVSQGTNGSSYNSYPKADVDVYGVGEKIGDTFDTFGIFPLLEGGVSLIRSLPGVEQGNPPPIPLNMDTAKPSTWPADPNPPSPPEGEGRSDTTMRGFTFTSIVKVARPDISGLTYP